MSEQAELCEEQADSRVRPPGTCIALVCPDSAVDASYFAAGLARRLADRPPPSTQPVHDVHTVLVDGLPGTGGIDVIADLEHVPGARWTALRGANGGLDTDRLVRALPRRDGVGVLSHDRALDVVDDAVRRRTVSSLADVAPWLVGTLSPERVPDPAFTTIVLLVRGSVTGVAAAQRYVEQMVGETPIVLVSLETPQAARRVIADALGAPLLTAAPTRWKLPQAAGAEVIQGQWPGASDRVLRRLLDDVVVYLRSQGRSVLWA